MTVALTGAGGVLLLYHTKSYSGTMIYPFLRQLLLLLYHTKSYQGTMIFG